MIIVIMGVSGSGKTTVGLKLSAALGWKFSDADGFHSAANVAKMQSGVPLTDEDREPWLRSIRAAIESWERDEPGHVLACSALKGCYRDALAPNDSDVKFVYLRGEFEPSRRGSGPERTIFSIQPCCEASLRRWKIPKMP
jgi:carbohydrate kinase, thermoresistant glucokinase family